MDTINLKDICASSERYSELREFLNSYNPEQLNKDINNLANIKDENKLEYLSAFRVFMKIKEI